MALLLLTLIVTLYCTSAHQCSSGELFCISDKTVFKSCGKNCGKHVKEFKMHFRREYSRQIIDPLSKFVIRDVGSTNAIHVIDRTFFTSASSPLSYFECDKHRCNAQEAGSIIDSALKEGKIVNHVSSVGRLRFVLQKKGGSIAYFAPYCRHAGDSNVAAFCIDDNYKVRVSLPLPVLTEQSVQLQKGDEFIIPSDSSPQQTFAWIGISEGAWIKIGRPQWKNTVEGEGTKKKYKDSVVSAINDAIYPRSKPITLNRGGKVIATITANGGLQFATDTAAARAVSEYEENVNDVSEENGYLQGYEDGYLAAQKLLARLKEIKTVS